MGRISTAIRNAILQGDPVHRTLSGEHRGGPKRYGTVWSADYPRPQRVADERRRNKVARRQRRVNRIRGGR